MAVTWSAPGRVNLIGEHIDYNGGPVLPFALDLRTTVTVEQRSGTGISVHSDGLGTATIPATGRKGDAEGWVRYAAAAVWAYTEATGRTLPRLDIGISSSVPTGAGLSSSAAVECAVLGALDELCGSGLGPREIAELATHAERELVGVPCGPMDQLAVMLAIPDHVLLIDSRTSQTAAIPLVLGPACLTLLVVDTRVRHALDDGGYADRQADCARAADTLGVDQLCDAPLARVPELDDPVLRRRAHHVVTEAQRVRDVIALLRAGRPADIGGHLSASHQSLAEDFEVSCPELDAAVDAALAAGALGARMTGGGFGGCALALCRAPDAAEVADRVSTTFARAGFRTPHLWPVTPATGAHSH